MSVDAKIRRVERDGNDLVLHLEPRWDSRVGRWSINGQDRLRIEQATWEPSAGDGIWGGSGVVIIVQNGRGEHAYDRISITHLRERW